MAEIETSGGGKKGPGVKKGKKLSTRIDLTPMVDLGFLLITFFIFTTTLSKPKTMDIKMPDDLHPPPKGQETKVKDYTALTLLLSKQHRIYYYTGLADDPMKPPKIEVTYFTDIKGIRQVIIDHKKNVYKERLEPIPGHDIKDEPFVMIKPDTNSTFDDFVRAFDEMNINNIATYAQVEIAEQDRKYIAETEAANIK